MSVVRHQGKGGSWLQPAPSALPQSKVRFLFPETDLASVNGRPALHSHVGKIYSQRMYVAVPLPAVLMLQAAHGVRYAGSSIRLRDERRSVLRYYKHSNHATPFNFLTGVGCTTMQPFSVRHSVDSTAPGQDRTD